MEKHSFFRELVLTAGPPMYAEIYDGSVYRFVTCLNPCNHHVEPAPPCRLEACRRGLGLNCYSHTVFHTTHVPTAVPPRMCQYQSCTNSSHVPKGVTPRRWPQESHHGVRFAGRPTATNKKNTWYLPQVEVNRTNSNFLAPCIC